MLENWLVGAAQLAQMDVLAAIAAGVLMGICVGAMPGLNAVTGVALMVPFTYTLPPIVGLALLISLYTAAEYGGSITAITIATPGTPAAAMTTVDGYPLTRKGQTGRALSASITSSTFGGIFSTIILILFSIPLAEFAVAFGPVEYFSLGVFGLSVIASLTGGLWLKGLLVAFIGLLIKTVGTDPLTGSERFTFDITFLYDGIGFLPVMLGLFAISEVFFVIERGEGTRFTGGSFSSERMKWREIAGYWKCMLRSSVIGTFVGIVPGAGASIGSIIAYNESKRTSKNPEEYGQGSIEGVVACESANNATVGGALVPLLTLGVPGSGTTAVLLGALMLQNLSPGPFLFNQRPDIIYGIFSVLFVANIVMLAVGLMGIKFWLRVVQIPPQILAPLIFGVSFIGAYSINGSVGDVVVMLIVGFFGYVLRKYKFPLLPMVIALVLGYMVETSLRRALILSEGSFWIFLESPLSAAFLLITVVSLGWAIYRETQSSRPQAPEGEAN